MSTLPNNLKVRGSAQKYVRKCEGIFERTLDLLFSFDADVAFFMPDTAAILCTARYSP